MERKEPYATQEECNNRIIHYDDIPVMETHPGLKMHIVSSEKMTVAFLTADPNIYVPIHQHEHEQIMITTDGALDLVIDGKLYPLKKGDVTILPSNLGHGAYISDKGYSSIEIFSPPRQDWIAKLEEAKKSQKQ